MKRIKKIALQYNVPCCVLCEKLFDNVAGLAQHLYNVHYGRGIKKLNEQVRLNQKKIIALRS